MLMDNKIKINITVNNKKYEYIDMNDNKKIDNGIITYHCDFDIFNNSIAKNRMITHYIYCELIDNEINNILVKREKPKNEKPGNEITYYKYSNDFGYNKNKIKDHDFDEFIKINKDNICELILLSTSIAVKNTVDI